MKRSDSFIAFRFCDICGNRFKPKGKETRQCDDCKSKGRDVYGRLGGRRLGIIILKKKKKETNKCPYCGKDKYKFSKRCMKCYTGNNRGQISRRIIKK